MSTQGILLIDLVGLGLIVFILNLVRTHALLTGYAVIWLIAVILLMVIVSVPPLQASVTLAVGATYPASALSLLAFIFIFIMLIAFSVQLTLLSKRQVRLMQALALRELQEATAAQNAAGDGAGVTAAPEPPAARAESG